MTAPSFEDEFAHLMAKKKTEDDDERPINGPALVVVSIASALIVLSLVILIARLL